MICGRCDKSIAEGEGEHVPLASGPGAGATVVPHRGGCRVARSHPTTYPAKRR